MTPPPVSDSTTDSTTQRLDRILESLQEIHVSLESLRVSLRTLHAGTRDHERRLRLVERWKHHLTPVLAALTFTLGALVTRTLTRFF